MEIPLQAGFCPVSSFQREVLNFFKFSLLQNFYPEKVGPPDPCPGEEVGTHLPHSPLIKKQIPVRDLKNRNIFLWRFALRELAHVGISYDFLVSKILDLFVALAPKMKFRKFFTLCALRGGTSYFGGLLYIFLPGGLTPSKKLCHPEKLMDRSFWPPPAAKLFWKLIVASFDALRIISCACGLLIFFRSFWVHCLLTFSLPREGQSYLD